MSTETPTQVLADTGGLVVTDDGRRVLVIDRGTGTPAVLSFVLGVLALIAGGFGIVALVAGIPSPLLGAVLLGLGLVLAVLAGLTVRSMRRRRSRAAHECRPVAVLDRKLGLFSYTGGALLPLDQVRFVRRMQIGSSSPKLVAVTPAGKRVLKRGNPFDGGIGNVDEVLTQVARGA
ncbi:hypothetical protein [Mycolicibacterium palauense]|uniref:hypothetical protein n=1 Tax=Mycolicibacterium palauense TaxID=2034511 RepID=UPI00159B9E12|nr:hypothetical protein [Mycolicibacterium palauense]